MLKSTPLRQSLSAPRIPQQPKKAELHAVLHDEAAGKRPQGVIPIAEAALRLGLKRGTLAKLVKLGTPTIAVITMPDGSKERLKVVKQGRKNTVPAEGLQAVVDKSAMVARSTMRLQSMMKQLGITGSTMRRHLVRRRGRLYFEVPSPGGKRRFEVKEASPTTKSIRTEDFGPIKRLFARMHGGLSFEELASDFGPENIYTPREAALLTGFTKDAICRMINKGAIKAEVRGGLLRIKGASIKKYFKEHSDAPKDLVGIVKAAKFLGHGFRWISRRLVKQRGREILKHMDGRVSVSIQVHRLNIEKGFSLSELSGLKQIAEKISFRGYLEKHEKTHADSIYERLSGQQAEDLSVSSACGQRVEEWKYKLIPEYKFPDFDVTLIRIGDELMVRREDAQPIVLSLLLRGSNREKIAAISELGRLEIIPERHYWLARGALMTTFGPLVKRLEGILARHDAGRPETA